MGGATFMHVYLITLAPDINNIAFYYAWGSWSLSPTQRNIQKVIMDHDLLSTLAPVFSMHSYVMLIDHGLGFVLLLSRYTIIEDTIFLRALSYH